MRAMLLSAFVTSFGGRRGSSSLPIQSHAVHCSVHTRSHRQNWDGDETSLMNDILARIRQVNDMPLDIRNSLLEFRVDDKPLGTMRPAIAQLLCTQRVYGAPIFTLQSGSDNAQHGVVTLTEHAGTTVETRSAAVAGVMEQLRDDGRVTGWRHELYPIKEQFDDSPVFVMERAAVPLIGAVEYGVHVNGLVDVNGERKMWMARRSKTKSKYPGMLDHIVAGGVPDGISLMDNVMKECMEEAGIPEELVKAGVRPVGAISYETYIPAQDTVSRAVLFCFDLVLPSTFKPQPVDGEVEEFFLMTMDDLKATININYPDPIKPNCYCVVIDYLMRAGLLSPDTRGYLRVLQELRQ